MLNAGDTAPDLTLPDETGLDVSLASLLARGPAVLFFYPGDFTPICTREACMVRDIHAELTAASVTVAGISADGPDKHARFKAEHGLQYTLLADEDKHVMRAYGVLGPLGMIRRASFLIGTDRTIRERLVADFRVARHERFLKNALALHRD